MRLNQFLARSGLTSRRKAEDFITGGKVTVNGELVTNLATNVNPQSDKIKVEEKQVKLPSLKYYLFNKPVGYTVTRKDKHASKTIFDILPDNSSLISVGRLDRDSEGLLIVTNDGEFAQKIIHPSNKIEKEYEVILEKPVTEVAINNLKLGIELDDGLAKATHAVKTGENTATIIILEGRKRQVRRMFESVGNKVTGLKRTRIGKIKLDVKTGEYRELSKKEIENYA